MSNLNAKLHYKLIPQTKSMGAFDFQLELADPNSLLSIDIQNCFYNEVALEEYLSNRELQLFLLKLKELENDRKEADRLTNRKKIKEDQQYALLRLNQTSELSKKIIVSDCDQSTKKLADLSKLLNNLIGLRNDFADNYQQRMTAIEDDIDEVDQAVYNMQDEMVNHVSTYLADRKIHLKAREIEAIKNVIRPLDHHKFTMIQSSYAKAGKHEAENNLRHLVGSSQSFINLRKYAVQTEVFSLLVLLYRWNLNEMAEKEAERHPELTIPGPSFNPIEFKQFLHSERGKLIQEALCLYIFNEKRALDKKGSESNLENLARIDENRVELVKNLKESQEFYVAHLKTMDNIIHGIKETMQSYENDIKEQRKHSNK